LAKSILSVIEDKKGVDILILDIRSISLLADYFVICTTETQRQTEAIVDSIVPDLKERGRMPRVEGEANSGWVLIDCGDVVVHLFSPLQRSYYSLEKLWKDAKVVVRVQ
jgi:ribosome-associated protein